MAEMTEREALEILELRIGCESVSDDECQNRSCWGCDYHVTGDEMIEAMKVAAEVLRERAEIAELTREGLEAVENVRVSEALANLLRPYRGCPRGPMGLPGLTYESSGGAMALLKTAEKYLVRGRDETFVCVPKLWFDSIVEALQTEREAGK